jgi:adenylate cyclase
MLANGPDIGQDETVDFDGEQWLAGLHGSEREQRRKLLRLLADDGFSEQELQVAVAENRLALLPVDRMLGGTHSAREIEQRSGLPADVLVRMRRLVGLAEPGIDERVFSEVDIEAARSTKLFLDAGFDEQRINEITRVLGEGMSRLSATITAAFVETFLKKGDSEAEVGLRFASLAEQLTPATAPILLAGFQAHLRDSVKRGMLGRAQLESGDVAGAQDVTVCFADLVGFTHLGAQIDVSELGTVASRLAELAASVTEPPVRLIKTIGDAAMFVSPEPGPLVEVALELVAGFDQEQLPSLRAGVAVGPAVIRAGDYYGHSVNLASRVTGIARPGSVLCTHEVRDAAADDFDWSPAGRHRLKGLGGPTPLFRARPATPAGSESDGQARKQRAGRSRKRASS